MSQKIIAVDGMGGDNSPFEVVKGCVFALKEINSKIVIVGVKSEIDKQLSQYTFDNSKIEVINASEIITNDESPTNAIRTKKDSSIVVGLNLLKKDEANAFVSAGATGALLAGATVIVGRIKGVERPALGTIIPTEKRNVFLIDSGANVDCKSNYLLQFAKMGSVYMENIMGIKNPKVALANIGAEKEKGNSLTKEAYKLLEESSLNFIGNIEAREIPLDGADVVVCDGFVGNIILKYTEGIAKAFFGKIKVALMSSLLSKVGALLSKKAFKQLKSSLSGGDVGGAPFLGLKALVVKAHGNADYIAIKNAIKNADEFIEKDIVSKIKNAIEN